ncbi:MAG TPA: J domain-containing protein [Ruminiclostridium sp.]|jgi:curved DNA-binding protein CbpA|nr:J domain-containing protein [Ruminiclostridium sp.]
MDPYKVLGVSPNASDEEIKAAYRMLAKKYHPDAYANNPLADLASEKMKEINMAYDQITKMRKDGGGSDYAGGYGSGYGSSYSSDGYSTSSFKNIRDMINSGKIADAKAALEAVPSASRNAEWHFLRGCVLYKIGWVNEAYLEFQNAVQMDPSNGEYREAFERIKNPMGGGNRNYSPYGGYGQGNPQTTGCNACDLCAGLACADCLCSGLGGC